MSNVSIMQDAIDAAADPREFENYLTGAMAERLSEDDLREVIRLVQQQLD